MSFVLTVRIHYCSVVLLAALAMTPARAGDVIFFDDLETIPIQSLRDNSQVLPGAMVDLPPATVTATTLTSGDTKLTLFVHGDGDQWSAIEAFGDAVGQSPAVGDCVRVKGTFKNFSGAAQISPMIWSADTRPFDCSGGTPSVLEIDSIATDTSSVMAGNQPGPLAEAYESALVTIQNVTVLATSTHTFEVYDGVNSGTYLLVDDFLYHYDATVGTTFSSITGVLIEHDSPTDAVYELSPRSAADIVVAP